jgi:hypothetical protein
MANTKVNLARLLKIKNRIASEITRKNEQIVQHNVFTAVDASETPKINIDLFVCEVQALTEDLITVKSLISRANNKIVDKIYRMSELKGSLAFYKKLNCREGKGSSFSYSLKDEVEYTIAQIKEEDKNNKIESLISEINRLQDELDEFNATHRVEIDERFLV